MIILIVKIVKYEDIIFDSKNKARIFFDISIDKLNRVIENSEQIKGYVLSIINKK